MLPPESVPVQGRRTRSWKDLWPLPRQASGGGSPTLGYHTAGLDSAR